MASYQTAFASYLHVPDKCCSPVFIKFFSRVVGQMPGICEPDHRLDLDSLSILMTAKVLVELKALLNHRVTGSHAEHEA